MLLRLKKIIITNILKFIFFKSRGPFIFLTSLNLWRHTLKSKIHKCTHCDTKVGVLSYVAETVVPATSPTGTPASSEPPHIDFRYVSYTFLYTQQQTTGACVSLSAFVYSQYELHCVVRLLRRCMWKTDLIKKGTWECAFVFSAQWHSSPWYFQVPTRLWLFVCQFSRCAQ